MGFDDSAMHLSRCGSTASTFICRLQIGQLTRPGDELASAAMDGSFLRLGLFLSCSSSYIEAEPEDPLVPFICISASDRYPSAP